MLQTNEEIILDNLFNIESLVLTVVSEVGEQYSFRIVKHNLKNNLLPNQQPVVDSSGVEWYSISQYHLGRNNVIDLYTNTKDEFKIYNRSNGNYEKVVLVNNY